jgi:hypothetical protein
MSFSLAPFAFALLQALQLYARIMARDGLMARPDFVCKAVAKRLAAGVRALEAYLRRVLILMALEIEPGLAPVQRPENLARTKARVGRVRKPLLRIYPGKSQFDFDCGKSCVSRPFVEVVSIDHLMARLDNLEAIANDPVAKAQRLAFTLARRRHGLLIAPPAHPRLLRRWGSEISAIHDAMAYQIMQKSKTRPPPLPPPRRGKPMITVFW